ncbi:MAG TPA: GAF domain-containing protein [Ktedonobacterales bacterium]|nr:GAF domain-containing protein [Ktedonobacterales bacterium]
MDPIDEMKETFAENAYHNAPGASDSLADAADTVFAEQASRVLQLTADVARDLIGAHQSAVALIVDNDWPTARKYFSLSDKYADWADYNTPAVGVGIHSLVMRINAPMRLTQAELEAHPEWRGFGIEAAKHPPMRGWLAAPLVGKDGKNYGLLQVSDKYEGEFTAEDEVAVVRLANLTSVALNALWDVRTLGQAGHAAPAEKTPAAQ